MFLHLEWGCLCAHMCGLCGGRGELFGRESIMLEKATYGVSLSKLLKLFELQILHPLKKERERDKSPHVVIVRVK